ncbi:hypothetical protein INR75_02915 [Zunongwangia sp. SCSIO 43204]|uniref:hypothetical protein n=1 Tax=Zunongwangia sp. SCSIO 43204 TaxID=2779359 RepID=UPI001CA937DB|nr:hypothetical protein [Zunongwangia sp. SCSIO 43204]UAB84998.1 hypothetical protein INR75_02915 [Zunongwangia sp. SCSIO 43204]
MKVELKLKPDTLIAVNKLLQKVYDLPVSTDKRENVYKSIGFDLADKLDKKHKNLIKKADLFSDKAIKITLKYHEAWALEEILMELIAEEDNPYYKTLQQSMINKINEKTI